MRVMSNLLSPQAAFGFIFDGIPAFEWNIQPEQRGPTWLLIQSSPDISKYSVHMFMILICGTD